MGLNIAVCIKPVPDSQHYDKITIDSVTKRVNREGIPTVINDLDKHAVEAGLALKDKFGGKVIVFTMAPDFAKENLREVLAMGADEAYLISDREFGGADTWATSYTLATAIKKVGNFDVVLLGNQSEDGGTVQVPSQLGEWLEIPHLINVTSLEYDGEVVLAQTKIDNGSVSYEVKLPGLFGVTREANTPRMANVMGMLKAKKKPLTVFRGDDLDVDKNKIGLKGSPTQPGEIFAPDINRQAKLIEGTPEEIVDQIVAEIKKTGINIVG